MLPINMLLLNISFIGNREVFTFAFSICHVTAWFNGHLVLWFIWSYLLNFLCDFTRLRSQSVMWLHGWFPVITRQHSVKYDGIDLVEDEVLSFQFDTLPLVITLLTSSDFVMVVRDWNSVFFLGGGVTYIWGKNAVL